MEQRHWHEIDGADRRATRRLTSVGSAGRDAAWPACLYGKLAFSDRAGNSRREGHQRRRRWTYRSFIEGGTLAAAVWTFRRRHAERFPDGLPVEMTIEVFRTYKGDIEKGVLGSWC